MTEAVIKATYADYRRVKGRKVLQLICEVPLEHAPLVHRLFGEPTPDESTWVAIAKLDPEKATESTGISDDEKAARAQALADAKNRQEQEKTPRKWEDLKPSQQAGIRCNEDAFHKFLRTQIFASGDYRDSSSADMVRDYCDVTTRADLNEPGINASWWEELEQRYQAWKAAPQHGIDG